MILQRHATITAASNMDLVGLNGTIMYETRNTLVLDTVKGDKIIPKHGSVLLVGGMYITGEDMWGRTYERVAGP